MHRPRFTCSASVNSLPAVIHLSPEQSHHLTRVLRRDAGDEVEIADPAANLVFAGRIISADLDGCAVELHARLPATVYPRITLFAGLGKPKACELVVQHCVEAGAASVCFFAADNSPGAVSKRDWPGFISRLERIRVSAAEQSRNARTAPAALSPNLETALAERLPAPPEETFVPGLRIALIGPGEFGGPEPQPSRMIDLIPGKNSPVAIPELQLENPAENDEIYLVVGPEGGFSLRELAVLRSYRFFSATLGPTVLRTETAALLACSMSLMLRQ